MLLISGVLRTYKAPVTDNGEYKIPHPRPKTLYVIYEVYTLTPHALENKNTLSNI